MTPCRGRRCLPVARNAEQGQGATGGGALGSRAAMTEQLRAKPETRVVSPAVLRAGSHALPAARAPGQLGQLHGCPAELLPRSASSELYQPHFHSSEAVAWPTFAFYTPSTLAYHWRSMTTLWPSTSSHRYQSRPSPKTIVRQRASILWVDEHGPLL